MNSHHHWNEEEEGQGQDKGHDDDHQRMHAIGRKRIVIIGAGPTGLGAANRLNQNRTTIHQDEWIMIEKAKDFGGLARSCITEEGFVFDMGGHVIFSHYEYFDQLIQSGIGSFNEPNVWETHQRVSYVRYKNEWVPYPFQNNLCRIPIDDQVLCINGLIRASISAATTTTTTGAPKNFDEWIIRVMGEGIANVFMRPYNFKIWGISPLKMQCQWLGERVAVTNAEKVIENTLRNREDVSWGPNATFRFPSHHGTGSIWNAIGKKLPSSCVKLETALTAIHLLDKYVIIRNINNGKEERIDYESLVSTIPLNVLLKSISGFEQDSDIVKRIIYWEKNLIYTSTIIIGLGIRGNPTVHGKKCWLYFPDNDICPFYRATIFSNYAKANCPPEAAELRTIRYADVTLTGDDVVEDGCVSPSSSSTHDDDKAKKRAKINPTSGPYWSLMLEVSQSSELIRNMDTIVDESIAGCINTSLLKPQDEIVSIFLQRLEFGYPVPTLERDAILAEALPFLEKHGVYSRGRFGSYKYEVGNQDHSVALGVECIDYILHQTPERTLYSPNEVNKPGVKNNEPKFTI